MPVHDGVRQGIVNLLTEFDGVLWKPDIACGCGIERERLIRFTRQPDVDHVVLFGVAAHECHVCRLAADGVLNQFAYLLFQRSGSDLRRRKAISLMERQRSADGCEIKSLVAKEVEFAQRSWLL